MNEIKENKELTFTQEDILKALLAVDEETRAYMTTFSFEDIIKLSNSGEYLGKVRETCDAQIKAYTKLKDALFVYTDMLINQKWGRDKDKKEDNQAV